MKKTAITTPGAPKPIAPYSPAIRAGQLLFISGQIAMDPITQVYDAHQTVEEETTQVMQNISALLSAADMGWEHVVKVTIFLKDMKDYAAVNGVYAKWVGEIPPAREAVQVVQLPRDCKVEISVIAHL
jgi:2-iminobutanoate/2-iminopropanoate deaminase